MRHSLITAALVGAYSLTLAGCTDGSESVEAYDLARVVAPRVAELEREVSAATREEPDPQPPEQEGLERIAAALTNHGASDAQWRSLFRDEVAEFGDAATSLLAAALVDEKRPDAERVAAADYLGAIGTRRAAAQLLSRAESATEPWLRAHSAFHLAATGEAWVVPRLTLRLKYERDHDAVIWIASTLARLGSGAGLEGLSVVAREGPTDALRASAAAQQAALAQEAGVADAAELEWRWTTGAAPYETGLRPGPRHLREIWRWIERLSEEQLRGVDDARFVLGRSPPWVAEELAAALHDEDLYIRLHVAQCLERMGGRATVAGPTLVRSLSEPLLAPAAAAALGRVRYPDAADTLVRCTAAGSEPDLRVAAARALGHLAIPSTRAALRGLLDQAEPIDLRQAAAGALTEMGAGDEVASLHLGFLQDPEADVVGAELALETWLVDLEGRGVERGDFVLERWRSLYRSAPGMAPSSAEEGERIRGRITLLEAELGGLLGEEP